LATTDRNRGQFTKDGNLLRPKGGAANPAILAASSVVGLLAILIGVWVPFAFESAAWKHDLDRPGFFATTEKHGPGEPLILKYPLLRMISRITLGERYHNSKIKLVQDLPSLLILIREEKFTEAEGVLLDLFSIGAFDEATEFVIWLQKTLKESGQIHKKIQSDELTLQANQEDEEQMLGEWQTMITDLRKYLHVPPVDDKTLAEHQSKCRPDNCERYEVGPLRGLPIQPELPEAPESLKLFGEWYVKQLSEEEKQAITDQAITEPLAIFKQKTSSLTTSYRQTRASRTKLRKNLNEARKVLKGSTYLMVKKLEDLIRTASAPPEIIFGDLLL